MGILYSFFKKHKVLSLIFIACTALSVLYKTWFIKFPEPDWLPLASELGEILYDLAIGTIASVIFFFVVVFKTDYEKRNAVSKKVRYHLLSIIEEGLRIWTHINRHTSAKFPPTEIELDELLSKIDPNKSWVTFAMQRHEKEARELKWKESLTYWHHAIKMHSQEIMKHIEYFQNDKLLQILINLDNADLFDFQVRPEAHFIRNQGAPMLQWSKDLYTFFQIINQFLEVYEEEFESNSEYSGWYDKVIERVALR